MPKKMVVVLWSRKTDVNHQGQSIDVRMGALEQALSKANAARKERYSWFSRKTWAQPRALFVAPEYLFSHPVGFFNALALGGPNRILDRRLSYMPGLWSAQQRHMDEADMKTVVRRLKALSLKYKHLLIVPGTIAWSKPVVEVSPALAAEIIDQARDRMGDNMDAPLAPVWTHRQGGVQAAPSPRMKIQRLHSLAQIQDDAAAYAASRGIDVDVARQRLAAARLALNTAVVLYRGQVLHVYHKQGDFHEVLKQYDAGRAYCIALPGRKDGAFQVGGITFGIEICLDHAAGALQRNPGGFGVPDVHIISSATVTVDPQHCVVKNNGHVLNCSCHPPDTGLWRYTPAALHPVVPFSNKQVAGYPFKAYEILVNI